MAMFNQRVAVHLQPRPPSAKDPFVHDPRCRPFPIPHTWLGRSPGAVVSGLQTIWFLGGFMGIGFHEDGYPNSWMEFISEHPFNMDEWGRRLIQIPKVVRSDPIGSDSPQSCAVWSYQNMMSIGSSEAQKDLSTKCLGKHQFCFSPLRVPDNTQLTEEPKWIPSSQWEFQDPKIEVLYHIRPYFVGIFPNIGLMYGRYLESIGSWNSHWSSVLHAWTQKNSHGRSMSYTMPCGVCDWPLINVFLANSSQVLVEDFAGDPRRTTDDVKPLEHSLQL